MSVVLVGFTLPSGNVRQKRREAKNESKWPQPVTQKHAHLACFYNCVKYLLHSSGKKRVHFIHQVEKLGWYEYYDCMHPFHNWMRGCIDNASVPIAPSASGWHIFIKEPTRIHCDASFSNFEWWKEKNRLERYSTKVTMHFTATSKHEWKLNFSTTAQVKGDQCQQYAHKHDMLQPLKCTYMNEVFPQNRSSRRLLRKLRKARTTRITFVPSWAHCWLLCCIFSFYFSCFCFGCWDKIRALCFVCMEKKERKHKSGTFYKSKIKR